MKLDRTGGGRGYTYAGVKEDEKYYIIGKLPLRIEKKAGTGRTLTHFLQNPDEPTSVATIKSISNWRNPVQHMDWLVTLMNIWATKDWQFTKRGKGQQAVYTSHQKRKK
jgi:hypothetical protein